MTGSTPRPPHATLLVIGVSVCTTFLASGIAKLRDPELGARGFASLGVPARLAGQRVVIAAAIGEIALATIAMFAPVPLLGRLTWWAIAALSVAFAAVIIVALARGVREPCFCFGALSPEPIDWRTVLRNAALATGALLVAASDLGAGIVAQYLQASATDQAIAQVGVLGVGAATAFLTLRQRQEPHAPGHETVSKEGLATPDAFVVDIFGRQHTLRRFRGESQALLLFVTPGCVHCHNAAAWLSTRRTTLADAGVSVGIVTPERLTQAAESFPDWRFDLLRDEGSAAQSLGIEEFPSIVYLGEDGTATISRGPVAGQLAIENLVDNLVASKTP